MPHLLMMGIFTDERLQAFAASAHAFAAMVPREFDGATRAVSDGRVFVFPGDLLPGGGGDGVYFRTFRNHGAGAM